jgi:hypothetical protein
VLCSEAARKELLNELIRRSLIKIEASKLETLWGLFGTPLTRLLGRLIAQVPA